MAVWITKNGVVGTLGDVVGYKAGLALSRGDLRELAPKEIADRVFEGDGEQWLRLYSTELEHLFQQVLYRVGSIGEDALYPFPLYLVRKYEKDLPKFWMLQALLEEWPKKLEEKTPSGNLDPTPFIELADHKFGKDGIRMAIEILRGINSALHANPFSLIRRRSWDDVASLQDLFRSESLETKYGKFFDQRFIDYLAQNFDKVDQMNWRKFEALTCEFFDKGGFHVEIGPGRDDDGIDARVWPSEQIAKDSPPAILVQCKREKAKIEKVVVKALYADILEEKASSGLIVTTSMLAPGADRVRTARAFPIHQIDR